MIEPLSLLVDATFDLSGKNTEIIAPAGLLLFGLITGFRHSLEADHIAAVSTIVASQHQKKLRYAPILGALWGLGHTASLFAVGLVVLLLAINIPEKVTGTMEFGVGIMLLFLGITSLTGFRLGKFLRGISGRHKHEHLHLHRETGIVHSHEHDHHDHKHDHRPIFVGMVHGIAGSGALVLVVLSTIDSFAIGMVYIALFGAGSIASMAAMSLLIGLSFAKAKSVKLGVLLKYATAIITIAIGVMIIYQVGIIDQIFS